MRTSSIAARLASASRKDASNAGADARPSGGVSLMRTALCLTAYMAIGLAVVVGCVPASFAQDSRVLDGCKSGATGIEEDRPRPQRLGSNTGVSVAVPIGRVCVGPELVDGEPSYVRRTTVGKGMTIVEVSTTPFMPVLASNEGPPGVLGRPDQPASW